MNKEVEQALDEWIARTYVTQKELHNYGGSYKDVIPHLEFINTIRQELSKLERIEEVLKKFNFELGDIILANNGNDSVEANIYSYIIKKLESILEE